jgi:choline dehydrogenase-like flavoprotein
VKERIVIIGSGASGVHFARTVLEKGYAVLMVDVGHTKPEPVRPADSFIELKRNLDEPAQYFLGPSYESLILPDHDKEYYGFPPNKSYIFRESPHFRYEAKGFAPLTSFAAGGLAEAWTGGSYPLTDAELRAFPFAYRDIEPYYAEVTRRIGISGAVDDMARFFPVHADMLPPLDLDEHSKVLLAAYARRKESLNRELRCYIGRSRSAVLSVDWNGRKRCSYSGRCLWGCASDSLYTPSVTLRECRAFPEFEYVSGAYASHFRFSAGGRIRSLVVCSSSGEENEIPAGTVVLAAGALSSARIFLQSIYRDSGEIATLRGLMDNRQVLAPFVNLQMIGRPYNPNTYQYHQLAIGVEGAGPLDYVHGLVTTLKTALIHPIVQSIPLDIGTALSFFRNLHAALGIVNINFSDTRRPENCLTLEPASDGGPPRLLIQYEPASDEQKRLKSTLKTFQKILWKLGCVAPGPMMHVRPMGASVHYAGAIPMSATPAPLTCSKECRSHDFQNLYFADGITFPELPSKNLTFTLMANAVRIAATAF